MKKRLICFVAVLLLLLPVTGCENNTSLFVGSLDTEGFSLDAPVFNDLNSMVSASELIVIGKTTSEAETIDGDVMPTTIHTFTVEETLKGDPVESVKFFQLGAEESDNYETKIKKNKTYVLFLTKNYTRETESGEEIIYNSISFEQGIFEVNDAKKLMPCTRIGAAPQLKDMRLENLRSKIREQVK
ncbi:MAG: hypothetical protein IKB04_01335 [Clostridia bacterium]|nr:hypothetical protein [Clostridia bacterium]